MTRLNYKLSAALLIVSAVPIAAIALAIQQRGFSHLLAERGILYHSEAEALARGLDLTVVREVDKLHSFCDISVVVDQEVDKTNQAAAQIPPEKRTAEELKIDEKWAEMTLTDEPLRTVLTNPLARQLRAYQERNSLANEIFITDRFGRVMASTVKTTDYIQSDESWWQKGASLQAGEVWFDQLHFDESARVYSLDMVIPLHTDSGELSGVLKSVFNVAPLFSSIPPPMDGRSDQIDIVRADGAVLARINQPDYTPLSVSMPASVMATIKNEHDQSWFLSSLDDSNQERMIGVSSIKFDNANTSTRQVFVLISIPADSITTPIKRQLKQFLLSSIIVLILCLAGAVLYVRLRITKPLELLRDGTRLISMSARLDKDHGPEVKHQEALQVVEGLHKIRTGDEIEELASSFATMGSRVLHYHRHLESEVAVKTALIQQDLEMAKEFQEAMMPDEYPTVPLDSPEEKADPQELQLHFWHLYKPAATLGGDFFDMFQISEHRAGLFVADVMGHGARSALVTAILRALLPGIVKATADPSEFMEQLNEHFLDIIERSGQTIFVTAFFMVLDTKNKTANYVTAGHPSPIYTNRRTGKTGLLIEKIRHQPALGLIKGANYSTHSKPLEPDDVFLIFTDGLLEAENAQGEMFGDQALLDTIRHHSELSIADLSNKVVSELARFTNHKPLEDDLCLVTAEVTKNGKHLE